MKYLVIGTKTILEPATQDVEEQYRKRPDVYQPIAEPVEEAKPKGKAK